MANSSVLPFLTGVLVAIVLIYLIMGASPPSTPAVTRPSKTDKVTARGEVDESILTASLETPCQQIDSPSLCYARSDCRAVMGTQCGGLQPMLLACMPKERCTTPDPEPEEDYFFKDDKLVIGVDANGKPKRNYKNQHPDNNPANVCVIHASARHRYAADPEDASNIPPTLPGDTYKVDGTCIPTGYSRVSCRSCCDHSPVPLSNDPTEISIGVLFYHEHGFQSLENSMRTWNASGLTRLSKDLILWVNGASGNQMRVYEPFKKFGFRVLSDADNLGIGKGLLKIMDAAKYEVVLLLEKDFALVENFESARIQLDVARRRLLSKGKDRLDAVRFRSRYYPGEPNCPPEKTVPPAIDLIHPFSQWGRYRNPITNQDEMWEPHLFCNNIHFWDTWTLLDAYPDRVWLCGCEPQILCFDSLYCGWTNNPTMFTKKWFNKVMAPIASEDCRYEDWRTSGFCKIQLEFTSYYHPNWIEPHHIIGHISPSLFTHYEINE